MDDERDAKAAIDELNGTTIDGQEVKVELSKPRSGGKIRYQFSKLPVIKYSITPYVSGGLK